VYFVDADGDIALGRIGAIISHDPLKYDDPEKVLKIGILREEDFLYWVSDEGDIVRDRRSK